MDQIKMVEPPRDQSSQQPDSGAEHDLCTLGDLELVLCAGGQDIPLW